MEMCNEDEDSWEDKKKHQVPLLQSGIDQPGQPKGSNPEKKAASFWTLSKSGLDPPPPLVLDTFGVTFVYADLGKNIPPKTNSKQPKKYLKIPKKLPQNFWIWVGPPPLGLVMKMHNPSLLRKTIYYGHPQFCEATGTIESCLESD